MLDERLVPAADGEARVRISKYGVFKRFRIPVALMVRGDGGHRGRRRIPVWFQLAILGIPRDKRFLFQLSVEADKS